MTDFWDRLSDEQLRKIVRELQLSAEGRKEFALAVQRVTDKQAQAEREAVAHVEKYGAQHSWTSCPPGTRAMCGHREHYERAVAKGEYDITEDADGFWLREKGSKESWGPYRTREEAINDRAGIWPSIESEEALDAENAARRAIKCSVCGESPPDGTPCGCFEVLGRAAKQRSYTLKARRNRE